MPDCVLPYGRQVIEDDDVAAVVDVLRSDWLTTGPMVDRFEEEFAAYVGAPHAVACSSGTAALHLSVLAAGIGPGDEVIVPPLTFPASANSVLYAGATVVFADVRGDTLTIDPARIAERITPRTKAIVVVDYAGLPCDLDAIQALAAEHGLTIVEDACHALGAEYRGRKIGSIAHLSCFSLHPVKHMTTGEGGVVTTADRRLAERVRILRNHGIASDHRQRAQRNTWSYDMVELGYNYRLSDIQCALGLSQMAKLPRWLDRRRAIASQYDEAFQDLTGLRLPARAADRRHAFHLYPVRVAQEPSSLLRERLFVELRRRGIGVNVHYLPVYLHSYYRGLGYAPGLCPVSERAYASLLSLPMWHGMTDEQVTRVVGAVRESLLAAEAV
jgi:perosamine synthetase